MSIDTINLSQDPFLKLASSNCASLASLSDDEHRLLNCLANPANNSNSDEPFDEVASFYAKRCVLITGATSFVGEILVERLLGSTKVDKVYILLRAKNGKSVQQRADEYKDKLLVFARLRNEGNTLDLKLRFVDGNVTQPRLALSDANFCELVDSVSIVFNCSGSNKLMQRFERAMQANVGSVKNIVELSAQFKYLSALIHVSSAFSNCHIKNTIQEALYQSPVNEREMFELIDAVREAQKRVYDCTFADVRTDKRAEQPKRPSFGHLNELAKQSQPSKLQPFKLMIPLVFIPKVADMLHELMYVALRLSNRPNTFTLTKAIAEAHFCEEFARATLSSSSSQQQTTQKRTAAAAIIRIPFVGGSLKHPTRGFVDKSSASGEFVAAILNGTIRSVQGDDAKTVNVMPVDMVANFMISCAWFLSSSNQTCNLHRMLKPQPLTHFENVYMFNLVSRSTNPLKWKTVVEKINELAYEFPVGNILRLPGLKFVRQNWKFYMYSFIDYKIVSLIAKSLEYFTATRSTKDFNDDDNNGIGCRKPLNSEDFEKIQSVASNLSPFACFEWSFDDANVECLANLLTGKTEFNFDAKSIDWNSYLQSYIVGVRTFLIGDSSKTLSLAKRQIKQSFVRRVFLGIFIVAFLAILFRLQLNF